MHRFSPFSTGAIKKTKKPKKKYKYTKEEKETLLINQLLTMGFSYDRAYGCLYYLEKPTIHYALDFFQHIEPNIIN